MIVMFCFIFMSVVCGDVSVRQDVETTVTKAAISAVSDDASDEDQEVTVTKAARNVVSGDDVSLKEGVEITVTEAAKSVVSSVDVSFEEDVENTVTKAAMSVVSDNVSDENVEISVTEAAMSVVSGEVTMTAAAVPQRRYAASWRELDARPQPEWYDRAKVGISVHWGVYSVPSYRDEWFWYKLKKGNRDIANFMRVNYPDFTYQDFAPLFTAEAFSPDEFADLFHKAGAKYVVLTTKHHDGFTLFPSRWSPGWNAAEVGPRRDLVAELARSVRARGMKFGVYYSLLEWYHPDYLDDVRNKFRTQKYVKGKMLPEIEQLIHDYKPSILWADGDWGGSEHYWNSTGLLAKLYNESPVKDEIVVNDRWGKAARCRHGGFHNCGDRYNPGHLVSHKWENVLPLDNTSWGYVLKSKMQDLLSANELLRELVSTVSCGGNILINVGPTKEGTIVNVFRHKLLTLGAWLRLNGEAIYSTSPWLHQQDNVTADVWYTCRRARYDAARPERAPAPAEEVLSVYAIFLRWPPRGVLRLGRVMALHRSGHTLRLIGYDGPLTWDINYEFHHSEIKLPQREELPADRAWTLEMWKDTTASNSTILPPQIQLSADQLWEFSDSVSLVKPSKIVISNNLYICFIAVRYF